MTNMHDFPGLPEIIAAGMSVTDAIQFSRWMLEHPERDTLTPEYFRGLLHDVVEAAREQATRAFDVAYG